MLASDPKRVARALREATAAAPVSTWQSLRRLASAIQQVPELRQILITASTFRPEKRRQTVEQYLHEWSLPLRNLIDILVETRSLDCLDEVFDAYTDILRRDGFPLVRIEAPTQIRGGQMRTLYRSLPGDPMKFLIDSVTNRDLIGGVRVTYEDREYDFSLAGALKQVEEEMELA